MKTEEPAQPISFNAGRDNRGAFASAPNATARNIEAGIYIENYFVGEIAQPQPGPIFYNLPNLPLHYRARDQDITEVRAKLLANSSVIGITSTAKAVGLHGMGGIGKTVLATAMAHDPELRLAFPDGAAWLTFGRGVAALAKAAELAFVLTGTRSSFENFSEARGRLGLITAKSRFLIILDDVWEPEAADAFTGLGSGCRLLITSREKRVSTRAQADRHELDLLDPEAARGFLAEASMVHVEALPSEADLIVQQCGRLPLALAAVGSLVRNRIYTFADALSALRDAALNELETDWLADREQSSVAVVLGLSVDALCDDARFCFLACAAFREDAAIPEQALLRLWSKRYTVSGSESA